MRILAEEMQDPTAKAMMLLLSEDYGRLAKRAGEEAALDRPCAVYRKQRMDDEPCR